MPNEAQRAPLEQLTAALGAPPPPAFQTLDAAELGALTAALEAALGRQAAELEAATDRSVQHLPRLLRGPIRRVLFG